MRGMVMSKKVLFELVDSLIDSSLPDGAWLQMLNELMDSNKKQFGIKQDSYDLVIEYLERDR